MTGMMKRILLVPLIFVVVACSKSTVAVPPDEGTTAEHAALDRVLAQIKDDFRSEGYSLDLKIPIVLIDPKKIGQNDAGGFCFLEDNSAVYIGIDPKVFNQPFLDSPPLEVAGYQMLLHEIGHCVFKRAHDYDAVTIPKHQIVLYAKAKDGTESGILYSNIPKSVMMPTRENYMLGNFRFYYIRELLEKDRIASLSEISRFVGVRTDPPTTIP